MKKYTMPYNERLKRTIQKTNIRVVKLSKNTNKFIQKYYSIRSAAIDNDIDKSNIRRALKNDMFSSAGYVWMVFEKWVLKSKSLKECLFRDLEEVIIPRSIITNYYTNKVRVIFNARYG